MKTRLLKISCLAFFTLTIFGCCTDCETKLTECEESSIKVKSQLDRLSVNFSENTGQNIDDTEKFCDSNCAIYKKGACYNTITGIAYFTIPIPSNMSFIKMTKTTNSITYNFKGSSYNSNTKDFPVVEGGFSTDPKSTLAVNVTFEYTVDECETLNKLIEKKKKSVIQGVPIIEGCKPEVTCP